MCDSDAKMMAKGGFLQRTTMPGFTHAVNRPNGFRTKAWLLFGCVGFTLTTFLVVYVLYDFLQFKTSIKVEMTQPSEIEYPSLTICGRSKISCRRLSLSASRAVAQLVNNDNLDLAHRLCKLLILTGCDKGGKRYEEREEAKDHCGDFLRRYNYDERSNVITLDEEGLRNEEGGDSNKGDIRFWLIHDLSELALTDLDGANRLLDSTLDLLPVGVRTSVMPFVEDILAGCNIGIHTDCRLFREEPFDLDCFQAGSGQLFQNDVNSLKDADLEERRKSIEYVNIVKVPTSMGLCFHMNLFGTSGFMSTSARSGGEHIEVVIRTKEQDGSKLGVTQGINGFTVSVHPPFTVSQGDNALFVSPNAGTFIELEERQTHRLPWPYHRPHTCIKDWIETDLEKRFGKTLVGMFHTISYHKHTCTKMCQLLTTLEKCNCVWNLQDDMNFRFFIREIAENGMECLVRTCNTNDTTCLQSSLVNNSETSCGCHPTCDYLDYEVLMSSSKWPSKRSWQYVAEKYNVSAPPNYDSATANATMMALWRDEVYDSLALINVRYASTGRMVTQEVPVYTPLELLSSMGGAMAIFMGISVFSYLELGEIVLDYVFGWFALS